MCCSKQKDLLVAKSLEEQGLDFFFPNSASDFLPGLRQELNLSEFFIADQLLILDFTKML